MGCGTGQSQQTSTTVFNEPNGLAELRSLIFLHHDVPHGPELVYKERFGIHVKIQTVVTFLHIGTCTTSLRMYVPVTYHTLYNDSSGSMMLVHIIKWYYRLVLRPAACYVCLHMTDSCVLGLSCCVSLVLLQRSMLQLFLQV